MKISVELSESEMAEIRRLTGESKKGPAIRKIVVDALMMKRREEVAGKFISGEWGADLKGYEEGRRKDREKAERLESERGE